MIAKIFRIGRALILVFSCAFAWGADIAQHKIVNGIDVFYGVVPAEVVQGHVKQHGAESMHGKTRLARGTHHLVVTLYDARTAARIDDATVAATVTQPGLASATKNFDVMKINDAISYGNYFSMPPDDIAYRISLSIRRRAAHVPITAEFDYRHAVGR